jgi:hypothetical protein
MPVGSHADSFLMLNWIYTYIYNCIISEFKFKVQPYENTDIDCKAILNKFR